MLAIPDSCREMFVSVSIQKNKNFQDEKHVNMFVSGTLKKKKKKTHPDVTNVCLEILQTENDESVESLRLQESEWRWSFAQSLCSSCTSRRATSMPESFHSSPHMWRALIFNTINHGGGFGSWEGGLYSLDWAFDSAFRRVLCLVTTNLDDCIR